MLVLVLAELDRMNHSYNDMGKKMRKMKEKTTNGPHRKTACDTNGRGENRLTVSGTHRRKPVRKMTKTVHCLVRYNCEMHKSYASRQCELFERFGVLYPTRAHIQTRRVEQNPTDA